MIHPTNVAGSFFVIVTWVIFGGQDSSKGCTCVIISQHELAISMVVLGSPCMANDG